MGTTAALKNELIKRIKKSENPDFLNALKVILDNSGDSPYQLSPDQEKAIEEGREQIKNGMFTEHSQVMAEAREWLEKK